jgi:hypothetical protein
MKKNIFAITAAAALVLNIAATSVTTFAADTTQTDPSKTTAKANLTTDDGEGNTAKLSLDSTPNIDFGSQLISADGNTFSSATIDNPLQVTNPGLDEGWSVTVASSAFTDGSKKLKGAQFKLNAGTVTNSSAADVSGLASATDFAPSADGSSQIVFEAKDSTVGVGVNKDSFAATSATLDVPAGNVAGNYTSNLTWTLTDVPAASTTTD